MQHIGLRKVLRKSFGPEVSHVGAPASSARRFRVEGENAMHRFTGLLQDELKEKHSEEKASHAKTLEERVMILEDNLQRTQSVLRRVLEQLDIQLDDVHNETGHVDSRIL
jgi:hypothetical protein